VHNGGSRRHIRKAPPKIDLVFSDNSPSVSNLNLSRLVKAHHPATHFDIQFVGIAGKLDDVRIFAFVR
jgi:hypothetical protein